MLALSVDNISICCLYELMKFMFALCDSSRRKSLGKPKLEEVVLY